MGEPSKRTQGRRENGERRTPVMMGLTSAAVAASIAVGFGAGMAQAVPHQGGTSPSDTAPQQGGTTPEQAAPQQGGTTPTPEVAPVVVPGPGTIPAPPQEAPYQPYVQPSTYTAPTYEESYDPVPQRPLTAPKPVAPVRPIAPPPEKIRVGNFITDIPEGMSERDVNSINAWSAYGEAKIAQGLISVGVPEDEASRQAASTIIGVMTGGTAGAIALGIPSAAVGVAGGALIGAGVGAIVGAAMTWPAPGPLVGPGAAIGAGIGAVVGGIGVGAAGAAVGAAIGGTAGGAIAYTLGAGDPGANPDEPWKPGDPEAKPLPNPDANQFELKLSREDAQKAGLPTVDYVVNRRGDVDASIAGFDFNWSAEQAIAPYGLLGGSGPRAMDQVQQGTKQQGESAAKSIPGLQVAWPQEIVAK
ncbi:hypothetical protein GIY30_24040 [Gordonia sp. HNM0687]|uniref:Glycine zipper family protein n=1 Tax=Gordonia mangrovi TaxID=2665643 RepID=A0A6L7GWQ5_9ACTN|nr:hypothetical protein [Gordonia mangrovi]MXP24396.1 hypothetical protein [Gordonia mangrovi]UVF79968.1 hypothetical protein NWF22_09170 [Gordonia mangrovi]